jgi:hypothetical protein
MVKGEADLPVSLGEDKEAFAAIAIAIKLVQLSTAARAPPCLHGCQVGGLEGLRRTPSLKAGELFRH